MKRSFANVSKTLKSSFVKINLVVSSNNVQLKTNAIVTFTCRLHLSFQKYAIEVLYFFGYNYNWLVEVCVDKCDVPLTHSI